MEDNDGSHGTRSEVNVVRDYKRDHSIDCVIHPAESPDLNPIEGVWNILKQRVRQRLFHGSIEELKQIIRDEWRAISQTEIQERIAEMPDRCAQLVEGGGERIRRRLW